jgi:hypothetical protein
MKRLLQAKKALVNRTVVVPAQQQENSTPLTPPQLTEGRRSSKRKRQRLSPEDQPSTSPAVAEMDCASQYASEEDSVMEYNLETHLSTLPSSSSPLVVDNFPCTIDSEAEDHEEGKNEDSEEDEMSIGASVKIARSLQQFLFHSTTVIQENSYQGDALKESPDRSVATNIADDGQTMFLHKCKQDASITNTPQEYTPEQLSDPEWCEQNIQLGTELLYPVKEVMKHMPKLTLGEIAMVELYNIVTKHCTSLGTFNLIVQLINREMLTGGFNKDVTMPTRKTFVSAMMKKFPCDEPSCTKLDPASVVHGIPDESGIIVDEMGPVSSNPPVRKSNVLSIFAWDAERLIKESLICPWLYGNEGNLIINKDNPFSRYIPHSSPNEIGTEVISGQIFQATHKAIVKDPEKQHIAAYYMYMDKLSSGDSQQRYNGEPVAIVCAYLKRSFRNMVKNWIVLGFLPDMELESSAKKQKRNQVKRGKVSYCFINQHIRPLQAQTSTHPEQKSNIPRDTLRVYTMLVYGYC